MKRISIVVAFALLAGSLLQSAAACPFCIAPMQTWAEMVAEADAVVLARLVSVFKGARGKAPFATVELVTVVKGESLLPGTKILRVDDYVYGKPGDLFLLKGGMQDTSQPQIVETFATENPPVAVPSTPSVIRKVSATEPKPDSEGSSASLELVWDLIQPVTMDSFAYITKAPHPDKATTKRLQYFLSFLEHDDELISADAWGEFANAQYRDIVDIRRQFPRNKLRTWISNQDTTPERLGLYGMMLGVCGTADDALFLQQQIGRPNNDIRFGVEGMMGGLLILAGEDGLQFLEDTRLKTADVSGIECFAVVQALQFVWAYEPNLFEKQRLRTALHPLLQHPEMREIVIRDLARWEDWSVVSQLANVYEQSKTEDAASSRAVVGFLLTCLKSEQATATEKAAAQNLLDHIQKDNARLVRFVENQFR